jgi:hypothetical protein
LRITVELLLVKEFVKENILETHRAVIRLSADLSAELFTSVLLIPFLALAKFVDCSCKLAGYFTQFACERIIFWPLQIVSENGLMKPRNRAAKQGRLSSGELTVLNVSRSFACRCV